MADMGILFSPRLERRKWAGLFVVGLLGALSAAIVASGGRGLHAASPVNDSEVETKRALLDRYSAIQQYSRALSE